MKEKSTAFCKKHPTGFVGKDQHGNYYKKCWTGHKWSEPCEIIIEGEQQSENKTQKR